MKNIGIKIIDYSYSNNYIAQNNNILIDYVLEPYFEIRPKIEKTIKYITLIGDCPYRKKIINSLSIPYFDFNGNYGKNLDNIFDKSNILINIHFREDYKILEIIRVYRALASNCIVLSEKSLHSELNSLNEFINYMDENNKDISNLKLIAPDNIDFSNIENKYMEFIKIEFSTV